MKSDRMTFVSDVEGWDNIAEQYSEWLDGGVGAKGMAFTNIVTSNVSAILGDVGGKEILDLGCGEGYFSRYLVERGAKVSAIDGAPNMIRIAKCKGPNSRIDFMVGDITQTLPYDSNKFDVVLCNMVLMDLEDVTKTFSEVARILKLGSKFVFSVVHPCYFDALGEWIDIGSAHPALRFKHRYIEQVRCMKKLVGLPSGVDLNHYNRPIQDYIKPLIANRLCISDFIETSFSREFLEELGLFQELMIYHLTANNLIIGATRIAS